MTSARLACFALCLPLLVGCGRVVFTPQSAQPIALSPEQQQHLAQQQQQIQLRANQLDKDNQELEALLAQERQRTKLSEEYTVALQGQLRASAEQLAAVQQQSLKLEEEKKTLMASVQQSVQQANGPFRVPAIQANNTLLRPLRVTSIPGVEARQDGDVIRVSLPVDQLFPTGGAQLNLGAEQLLRTVASDVLSNYPDQVIGIEGHTDGAPVSSPQFPTSHHLSVAQATSVYDAFRRVSGAPAQQLFVIGHGANHPLVSNGTESGRQKNRRVELVIYPETMKRR